ncbi:MAG: serine hydrolase [Chloroflexota bacterium]|nr:serine hydrolase [Chloroflexota bacterium]MDE2908660.1 serine hydrolase [Chloroflexota bacterium]
MPHALLKEHPDLATAIDLYDAWIRFTMRQKHQPGLALGIVYEGELLWGQGYGCADIATNAPVTLDTRFRIASISKTFTAIAILQMRDAGALILDDPVAEYLDWFDLQYQGAPAITIRNLLTHTSGLPRDSHNPMWTECDAPEWDEFVAALKSRPPTRPPYDKFAYSNVGYSLLGGVIEQVSGQSWADYLQRNIVDPLEMSETHPVPQSDDPQLATGYSQLNDDYQREPMPFFLMKGFEASANFASSINDLVKYAAFHLSDEENAVLSPHSLRDMHRIHWLEPKWDSGYGLGSMQYKLEDWSISGHGGGYPGYLTGFTLCREQSTALIVLTNALGSAPTEYINQGYKLVLPEIIKATKADAPEADPAWQIYLGEYVHEWGYEKVILREGQLQIVSLDGMDYPPVILEPTDAEHSFTMREQGGSNECARFELDESGAVLRLWLRNEYAFKKR